MMASPPEYYRPGGVPRGEYAHAEASTSVRGMFVWCVYLRSNRRTEDDLPRLEAPLPDGCSVAVLVGDCNTASAAARDAILSRFRLCDDDDDDRGGAGGSASTSLGRWSFPCTSSKRRSLLQCQLEKVHIRTCTAAGAVAGDAGEVDADGIFSAAMLNGSLMRRGYVNKRQRFVTGGLLGCDGDGGGDGGGSARHVDKGCKDYILTARSNGRPGEDEDPVVLICSKGMAWERWDGEHDLPTSYHWSDHAAVIRKVATPGNSDAGETSCTVATLNMAADQASPFEWFHPELIPLYSLIAGLIERPLCDFDGAGPLPYGEGRYDALCALLREDEERRCGSGRAQNRFDPDDRTKTIMELMIMKCASSDKRIQIRPCLKNCTTVRGEAGEGGGRRGAAAQHCTDFVTRVVRGGEGADGGDDGGGSRWWWHDEFFKLWRQPERDMEGSAPMSLSDHVLRFYDWITMTAVAMLGGTAGGQSRCIDKILELLSHEPHPVAYKAQAISALIRQRDVRCCCLTDLTAETLRHVMAALNSGHNADGEVPYVVAASDFNPSGRHGVAIIVECGAE